MGKWGGGGGGGNGLREGGALSASKIWVDPPAFKEAVLERSEASLPGSRVPEGDGGGWSACPPQSRCTG